MSHVEQLERDTEQTRARIANTLDELRACMTPGHILDEVADRLNEGAPAAFARNLKDQAVNNPLPVALIGAGLAWLMLSGGSRSRSAGMQQQTAEATAAMTDAMGETTDVMGETGGSMAGSAREAVSEAAGIAGETTASMADSMQRTASAGYDAIADGARRATSAVSASTRAAGQQTLQSGSAVLDFCREQPLVLAGLGIALGAVMGALLPASDAENRLLGETADRVKKGAQDVAAEEYRKAEKVGERAVEAARDEAARQASEPAKDEDSKAEPEASGDAKACDAKAEDPTLVPSGQSELERQGQPWTAENAPL